MIELNDELLSALLDEQLDEPTRLAVEQALADDPGARVRLERMRNTDALLRAAIPEFPSREHDPLAARIEQGAASSRAWYRLSSRAVAACLLATVGGLLIGRLTRAVPDYWVDAGGTLHGTLQQALEQHASGGRDLTVRVLLSTQLRDGRYCRQFVIQRQGGGEGLACRNPADPSWQLVGWDAAAPAAAAGFRPAGVSDVLDALLDRLGAGEALDVDQERALIEQQWRGGGQ